MFTTAELEWLFSGITICRNIFPGWYVATGVVLALSILASILLRLKKFGLLVLLTGAAMSTTWELVLFVFGFRSYDNPLASVIGPVLELIYHSFSETGATILLGMLIIYKIGIIDLDKFKDEIWDTKLDKTRTKDSDKRE